MSYKWDHTKNPLLMIIYIDLKYLLRQFFITHENIVGEILTSTIHLMWILRKCPFEARAVMHIVKQVVNHKIYVARTAFIILHYDAFPPIISHGTKKYERFMAYNS